MSRSADVLLALIVALVLAAGAVLVAAGRPAVEERSAREFHELVGGLGFGAALDLSACEFSLDPRLCPACSQDVGPVPDGRCFCREHAASVLDLPDLRERE